MMFDHLAEDRRLLPSLKRELKKMEKAVYRLTQEDSRFFSDRNHAARQVLDRITQRSLAFSSDDCAPMIPQNLFCTPSMALKSSHVLIS